MNDLLLNKRHGAIPTEVGTYGLNHMYDIKNEIKKEVYFFLLMTAVILIEESLIKKDSSKKELHFNYDENKQYIPVIEALTKSFTRDVSLYDVNYNTVVIEKENIQEKVPGLALNIWILNKLKDSFVHGAFKPEVEEDNIVILNTNIWPENEHYTDGDVVMGKVNTVYKNGEKEEKITHDELKNKHTYLMSNNLPIEELENFVKAFDNGFDVASKEEFYSQYSKPFKYFEGKKMKEYDPNDDPERTKELIEEDNKLIDKTVNVINIIAGFLKNKNITKKEIVTQAYIYMNLFAIFASRDDSDKIRKKGEDDYIRQMINELFLLSKWTIDEESKDEKIVASERKIAEYLEKTQIMVNQILDSPAPEEYKRKRLKYEIELLDKKLEDKYKLRKEILIRTIRNAISHNNIYVEDGIVYVYDTNSQNGKEEIRQKQSISLEDFRESAKAIERIYIELSEEDYKKEETAKFGNKEIKQQYEEMMQIAEEKIKEETEEESNKKTQKTKVLKLR